jgi:hypothetical protein
MSQGAVVSRPFRYAANLARILVGYLASCVATGLLFGPALAIVKILQTTALSDLGSAHLETILATSVFGLLFFPLSFLGALIVGLPAGLSAIALGEWFAIRAKYFYMAFGALTPVFWIAIEYLGGSFPPGYSPHGDPPAVLLSSLGLIAGFTYWLVQRKFADDAAR